MLSRSKIVGSWCNVARGLVKVLGAIGDSVLGNTTPSSNPHNNNNNNNIGNNNKQQFSQTIPPPPTAAQSQLHQINSKKKNFEYRGVPASRTARAVGFASLFFQLGAERVMGTRSEGNIFSAHAHQRIVETLCRMRGAVLKLGQMLSIQDASTVPPHITQIFERVRDSAYAMPREQLHRTLEKEYKNVNWRRDLFVEFNEEPMAAASIGQVHRATVKGENDKEIEEVAVKVQYPGVARSIDSDVSNLKMLISLNLLPPGMFVDNILQELRQELSLECRYTVEAAKQIRYGELIKENLQLKETFIVPKVYQSLSTDSVLVTQLISGVPIDKLATVSGMQDIKNYVAQRMMLLTLYELFHWHFMQTDPNYSNFLFDAKTNKIGLLDFGAAREYSSEFVKNYLEVVAAAAREDRETIISKSIILGFLTGNEMKDMLDAHVSSVMLLGKPFRHRDKPFDFSAEHLPSQIQAYVPTMIKLRLRPPPTPVYSLHRRLSGTILLATKLKATIPVGEIFWDIYDNYKV